MPRFTKLMEGMLKDGAPLSVRINPPTSASAFSIETTIKEYLLNSNHIHFFIFKKFI